MALIDIATVEKEALKEINDELAKKAKDALVRKLRELAAAKQVVAGIQVQLDDLKQRIADGTL